MSTVDDILTILTSYHGGYRVMWKYIRGGVAKKTLARQQKEINEQVLRVTLGRLKQQGLVENTDRGFWSITKKGRKNFAARRVKNHNPIYRHRSYRITTKQKKNMVITFDVPETLRRKRDWLRVELIALGFEPLQKSVWFGPGPLPEEFIQSLNELKLIQFLKFFRATQEGII